MGVMKNICPGKKRFKRLAAGLVLWFLGRGFKACAVLDSRVKGEVGTWEDDTTIMLKIDPSGPCMVVGKRGGRIKYLGHKECAASLEVHYKNLEGALLTLTGRSGLDRAYAEHRFTMKGDLSLGMSFVRCVFILEAYLFPSFMARKVLKRVPKAEKSKLTVYAGTLFGTGR